MYEKRIRIFVFFSLLMLAACVVRLAQMQLTTASSVQSQITELKRQKGQSEQFKTLRGRILDRKGKVLAMDHARFWIHVDYELSCYLDDRVRQGLLLKAAGSSESETALAEADKEIRERIEDLRNIIDKCSQFKAVEAWEIENEIRKKNDKVWNLRVFQAWRKKFPNSEAVEGYDDIGDVPGPEARDDFVQKVPDPNERLALISKVDIREMHQTIRLLELETDDDIFAAQLEFMDTEGVHILPEGKRVYPCHSVAAQTIGWVGKAQEFDEPLFADEKLATYRPGETCGRRPGVEFVCEAILRGRRGEVVTDIDGQLKSDIETRFGADVSLTLDIELQAYIEDDLARYSYDPNLGDPNVSAVVIDVGTSEILALVSLPGYDLNRVRYDYDSLMFKDPNKPMINRAINALYPPGSVVKPLLLVAGLEAGKITSDEPIECPAAPAPAGWPNCLAYTKGHSGHSLVWQNNARNAIKGSCNIYFSRLADRIEPVILQQWLFRFGYGQHALSVPYSIAVAAEAERRREFLQPPGEISSKRVFGRALPFEEIPPLAEGRRKQFGIGQGSLRVTPLQVANSMATIARGGVFKLPRLFGADPNRPTARPSPGVDLGISPETLDVVYDGMNAVISEPGGTANKQFGPMLDILRAQDVKVYGKTGSTTGPFHAWFAGFAADSEGRKIALAVIVEEGQSGARDVAPLASEIIQLCIQTGYLGQYQF